MKKLLLLSLFLLGYSDLLAQTEAGSLNGKYRLLIKEIKLSGKTFKELREKLEKQTDWGLQEEQIIEGEVLPKGYWVYVSNEAPQLAEKTDKDIKIKITGGNLLQLGKSLVSAAKLYIWKEENPNYVPTVADNTGSQYENTYRTSQATQTTTSVQTNKRSASNLVAYYDFKGNLRNQVGSKVPEAFGAVHYGKRRNEARTTIVGQAIHFGDEKAHVVLGKLKDFVGTNGEFTVTMWIYHGESGLSKNFIQADFELENISNSKVFKSQLFCITETGFILFHKENCEEEKKWGRHTRFEHPKNLKWYHVALRFDGQYWSYFVDGELLQAKEKYEQKFCNTMNLTLGPAKFSMIGNLCIFKNALSDESIKSIYTFSKENSEIFDKVNELIDVKLAEEVVQNSTEKATTSVKLAEEEVVQNSTEKNTTSQTTIPSKTHSDSPAKNMPLIIVGEIKDSRDGRTYKVALFGNKRWFAENLKYKPVGYRNTPIAYGEYANPLQAENAARQISSYCYGFSDKNLEKYGVLYKSTLGVCPQGWHVATESDWKDLEAYFGYKPSSGAIGSTYDTDYGDTNTRATVAGEGLKNSPFNPTWGGGSTTQEFIGENGTEYYWAVGVNGVKEYARWLRTSEPGIGREYSKQSSLEGAYCRCVEDKTDVDAVKAAYNAANQGDSPSNKPTLIGQPSFKYEIYVAQAKGYPDLDELLGKPRIAAKSKLAPASTQEYVFQELRMEFFYDNWQGNRVSIILDGFGKKGFPMTFALGTNQSNASVAGFTFDFAGNGQVMPIYSGNSENSGFVRLDSFDTESGIISGYFEFVSEGLTSEKVRGTFKNIRVELVRY